MVSQSYATHVNQEYVITGNDVLFKCGIPSHVADFIEVLGWEDSEQNIYLSNGLMQQGNSIPLSSRV